MYRSCVRILAGVSAIAMSYILSTSDNVRGEQRDGSAAEALVYLDNGKIYRAVYNKDTIQTTTISLENEVVKNFAIANGKYLFLMQSETEFPVQAQHGKNAVTSTVATSTGSREGSIVTTIELSALPGIIDNVDVAFNGEAIAYAVTTPSESSLFVLNLKTGKMQSLAVQKGAVLAPAWAPDGKKIAYYAAADAEPGLCLRIVDVDSGQDTQLAGLSRLTGFGDETREPPLWSGDGNKIYFYAWYKDRDSPGVYEIPMEGRSAPTWLGIGLCVAIDTKRGVIYVVNDGVYSMQIADPKQRSLVVKGAWWPKVSPSGRLLAYVKSDALYIKTLNTGTELRVVDRWQGDGKKCAWDSVFVASE